MQSRHTVIERTRAHPVEAAKLSIAQKYKPTGRSLPIHIRSPTHDNDAPTKRGATHTPSFVRMRCTDFVAGSTHAASRVSSVVNPGCTVSKIFFFGLSWESGSPPSKPSKKMRSPTLEPAGGCTSSIPASLPSLCVA